MNTLKIKLFMLTLLLLFLMSACAPKSMTAAQQETNNIQKCATKSTKGSHATYFMGDNNSSCLLKTADMVDLGQNYLHSQDPTYFYDVEYYLGNTYVPTAGDVAVIQICDQEAQNSTDPHYYKVRMTSLIQAAQFVGMDVYVARCSNPTYGDAVVSILSTLNLPNTYLLE